MEKKLNDQTTNAKAHRQIEAYCKIAVLAKCRELGFFQHDRERYTLSGLQDRLSVSPEFYGLLEALLDILKRGGFIEQNNGFFISTAKCDSNETVQKIKEFADHSLRSSMTGMPAHLAFLSACVEHLDQVLQGAVQGSQIIFPNGSGKLLEDVFKENRVLEVNQLLGRAAGLLCKAKLDQLQQSGDASISILEIGSGMGASTRVVLEALSPYAEKCLYFQAHPDKTAAIHYKWLYGKDYPFARFMNPGTDQSAYIEERGMDIVIAANTLHAERNLDAAVGNLKKLLKPDGVALLVEFTSRSDFETLTFGLTEAWWGFEDTRLDFSPRQDFSGWKKLLEKHGFKNINLVGHQGQDAPQWGAGLIMAENSGRQAIEIRNDTESAPVDARSAAEAPARTFEPGVSDQGDCAAASQPGHGSIGTPQSLDKPALSAEDCYRLFQHDLRGLIGDILHIPMEEMEMDRDLTELGMDSVMTGELVSKLGHRYQVKLSPTLLFTANTGELLASALNEKFHDRLLAYYDGRPAPAAIGDVPETSDTEVETTVQPFEDPWTSASSDAIVHVENDQNKDGGSRVRVDAGPVRQPEYAPIAVIGMAGLFPQSKSPDELWRHLVDGREAICDFPLDRWNNTPFEYINTSRDVTLRAGIMPQADLFDAGFFNMSSQEAMSMDPRQRLLLQTVWHAIENAGYKASRLEGSDTSVYVGFENNEYAQLLDRSDPWRGVADSVCMLANRISCQFDFKAASESIDTSCASALTAVHRAVKSLQAGECSLSIAAGVSVLYSPDPIMGGLEKGWISPDGHCRTFDKNAKGWVIGEGVGAVLLKPLDMAIRDGDHIHGLLAGSVVEHLGKAGARAVPDPEKMADVAARTYQMAGFPVDTITYAELHGIGSPTADAAEIESLQQAFAAAKGRSFCAIGSMTPNIGNLEPVSGMAGLFKILLAFRHRTLPPNINLSELNPYLDLEQGPFYICTKRQDWKPTDVNGDSIPRRAALNSYGAGGSVIHFALEEYRSSQNTENPGDAPFIFPLSAKNRDRLLEYAGQYLSYLRQHPELSIEDVVYTLQVGRDEMNERLAIVAGDREALLMLLENLPDHAGSPGVFLGTCGTGGRAVTKHECRQLLKSGDLEQLAALWVEGAQIPWEELKENAMPGRISLPGYPFEPQKVPIVPAGCN
jgi:polyketide synthase PksN